MESIFRSTPRQFTRLLLAVAMLTTGLMAAAPAARAADGVTATIHLHSCPDGFDGINTDIYGFAANCHTPIGGINFAFQSGNLAPSKQTDLDGNVTIDQMPAGSMIVTEFPPDPSWLLRAFCSVYDTNVGPSGYLEAPVGQGGATFNIQAGQALDCEWYNFPFVAPTNASVSLRLHGCPEGFDGINASIYDLAQYCHTPLGGVDFAVQYGNLAPAHQTDLDGTWTFTDVTTGPITVTEIPPVQGWAIRAFCSQFNENTGPSNYLEAPAGQGSASWTLSPNQSLDCDWYNFPFVTPTVATVLIRAHGCPNGYDAGAATIYELAANCHGVPKNVTFTLKGFNVPATVSQTDNNGWVTWQSVPSGKLTIQEALPNGVDLLRIFCNQRKLTGEELGFTEVAAAPDGTLTDQLLSGYDEYDCDWFNGSFFGAASGTPVASPVSGDASDTGDTGDTGTGGNGTNGTSGTGGTGNGSNSGNGNGNTSGNIVPQSGSTALTIIVVTCPTDYNVSTPGADPANECQDAAIGTDVSSLGAISGTLTTKTTGDDGSATFPNLKSGIHIITVAPAGPFAYGFILDCSSNMRDFSNSPFIPLTSAAANGSISIDVLKGEHLSCRWFEVPASPPVRR